MAACAAVFSLSLGAASVALPLLALHAGYSGAAIGVLTALSAVSQMATRSVLGHVLSRHSDRLLIIAAPSALAVSNVLVVFSAALVPFALAQLAQGVARACFWTGSQTHVVREPTSTVPALAAVNFVSSFGLLAGPILAGTLAERDPRLSLAVAAGVAAVAAVLGCWLRSNPPFQPPARERGDRIWRRPAVSAGCWAGVSAGAWRGLLGSFVPVVLAGAGQSAAAIGGLVAVANGASLVGAGLTGRVPRSRVAGILALSTAATGLGTAATALTAAAQVAAGAGLAVSGLGAGALQTLGPALAAESVHPEERGLAIAATGTFRAAALLVAPLAVSGLVLLVPPVAALTAAGVLAVLPAVGPRSRRSPPR